VTVTVTVVSFCQSTAVRGITVEEDGIRVTVQQGTVSGDEARWSEPRIAIAFVNFTREQWTLAASLADRAWREFHDSYEVSLDSIDKQQPENG